MSRSKIREHRMSEKTRVQRECKCKVCGHVWWTLADKLPKVCPKCKSYKWAGDKK